MISRPGSRRGMAALLTACGNGGSAVETRDRTAEGGGGGAHRRGAPGRGGRGLARGETENPC